MMRKNALEHTLVGLELEIVLAVNVREPPLARDDDLLAAGELVARAAEGLVYDGLVGVFGADGEDDLADVDARDGAFALWLLGRVAFGVVGEEPSVQERVAGGYDVYL